MYECSQNFSLNGSEAVRTCEAGDQADAVGVWSREAPACERELLSIRNQPNQATYTLLLLLDCSSFSLAIECQQLTLVNGKVLYAEDTTNPYSVGTMATLSCDVGYFLVQDRVRHCLKNDQVDTALGQWSGNNSYCQGTKG